MASTFERIVVRIDESDPPLLRPRLALEGWRPEKIRCWCRASSRRESCQDSEFHSCRWPENIPTLLPTLLFPTPPSVHACTSSRKRDSIASLTDERASPLVSRFHENGVARAATRRMHDDRVGNLADLELRSNVIWQNAGARIIVSLHHEDGELYRHRAGAPYPDVLDVALIIHAQLLAIAVPAIVGWALTLLIP
jgi:hypothetical protein